MLLSAVMEKALVSVQTKQEYVQAIYARYRGARRPEKQRILDEFCAVTKQHRKHAIRLLDGPLTAASALKMSYAGITKGFTALGAAMMLAALDDDDG